MSTVNPTVMWEAKAAAEQEDELLEWVLSHSPREAMVYRSAEGGERVVVIDPTGTADEILRQTPEYLVERAPHAWQFELIRNG